MMMELIGVFYWFWSPIHGPTICSKFSINGYLTLDITFLDSGVELATELLIISAFLLIEYMLYKQSITVEPLQLSSCQNISDIITSIIFFSDFFVGGNWQGRSTCWTVGGCNDPKHKHLYKSGAKEWKTTHHSKNCIWTETWFGWCMQHGLAMRTTIPPTLSRQNMNYPLPAPFSPSIIYLQAPRHLCWILVIKSKLFICQIISGELVSREERIFSRW